MRRPYKHIDLQDKFSDFEYTPNDSNWDTISGGLNPKKAPGNLAEKFADFQVAPDKEVWNEVATSVNPQGKKKLIAFWLKNSGIAAAFIGVIVSLNLSDSVTNSAYVPRQTAGVSTLAQYSAQTDQLSSSLSDFRNHLDGLISGNMTDHQIDQGAAEDINSESIRVNSNKPSFPQSVSGLHQLVADLHPKSTSTALLNNQAMSSEEDSTVIFRIDRNQVMQPVLVSSITSDNLAQDVDIRPIDISPLTSDKRTWDFKLSGLLAENTNELVSFEGSNEIETFVSASFIDNPSGVALTELNSLDDIGFSSLEEFSTPVSFSVNGEKNLAIGARSRFKLGLGLGFLRFNSTVSQDLPESENLTEIDRKYITIPLYAKYNFLDKEKIDAYVKIGSTGELGVSGKIESQSIHNGVQTERSISKFKLGTGQVNVNSGVGTEFKISNTVNAFAEFSLAHYYAESQYTFWSNQNLWPLINTGITLKLQ